MADLKVMDRAELLALQVMNTIPEQRRLEFQMAYHSQKKERTTALLLSLFLGYLGVDRFYLGQTGLGVIKFLTLGGCGLWMVLDWLLIMGAADKVNTSTIEKLRLVYPALPPHGYQQQHWG